MLYGDINILHIRICVLQKKEKNVAFDYYFRETVQ